MSVSRVGGRAPEIPSLANLPPDGGQVAFGTSGNRDWQQFTQDLRCLTADIHSYNLRRWLIASEDSYDVALGLLATVHAGSIAVLPANLQPGHLVEIGDASTGLLTNSNLSGWAGPKIHLAQDQTGRESEPVPSLASAASIIHLHTSGSTGSPTTIEKTLQCLDAEVAVLDQTFDFDRTSRVLGTVPPYHMYGLLFRVLWPLAAQRSFCRDMIRFPGELVHILSNIDKAVLISSPAYLKRAYDVLDLTQLDGSIDGIISSGGPLPPTTASAYNRRLSRGVTEIYGSTETGAVARRIVDDATNPSHWRPLDGIRIKASDDDGILKINSPFVFGHDWHPMGDRVTLHGETGFELLGRADRIVKVEERRISLDEIERRLVAEDSVQKARILVLSNAEQHRTILGAVVVPSDKGWCHVRANGKSGLRDQLLRSLGEHLDRTVLPRRWRFVGSLPETAHGKIQKQALLQLFDKAPSGDLPTVVEREEDETNLALVLDVRSDHPCFDGHFADRPILAGVVQVEWAMRFALQKFEFPFQIRSIDSLKFFKVILPGQPLALKLQYNSERQILTFHYACDGQPHSTGRINIQSPS